MKGTRDVLPEESVAWRRLEESVHRTFALYGFEEIRTPVLEDTALFQRGIGDATDIVSKEMYTFPDRKGRSLTLRPENTAPVVRACLENGLLRGRPSLKLYYLGPMFRYERPQQGRMRQFTQAGAEVIGRSDPLADAELIEMILRWLRDLGLQEATLRLNSVGCAACRPGYAAALRRTLEKHLPFLCSDCQRRHRDNPLRMLDCKIPQDQPRLADAPAPMDHLCQACRDHFAEVRRLLERLEIEAPVDPRLVRGLDYYTRTTFEVAGAEGLGSQSAILGGGRYDGLFEVLGGPPTPALGFAVGLERLLMALPARAEPGTGLDLFVVHHGEAGFERAVEVSRRLRASGLRLDLEGQGRSLKAQMREASRRGARYALIIGEEEARLARYGLKRMADAEQVQVDVAEVERRLTAERQLPVEGRGAAGDGTA